MLIKLLRVNKVKIATCPSPSNVYLFLFFFFRVHLILERSHSSGFTMVHQPAILTCVFANGLSSIEADETWVGMSKIFGSLISNCSLG